MKISQEEEFFKIIKFTPAIFFITISFFVIVLLYFENKNTFETEKKELEDKFILENKQQIKDEVVKIKQFIRDVQAKMHEQYMDESENIDRDEFRRIIQENVLNYISLIKFDKTGYIFVITYDGIYLNHARKSFIGKHYLDNNDTKNISKVIEDLTQIAKNGGGYYSYIQNYKPGSEQPTQKISYVEGLDDWKWMIGTGFYEDEVQEEVKKLKNKFTNLYTSDAVAHFLDKSINAFALFIGINEKADKELSVFGRTILTIIRAIAIFTVSFFSLGAAIATYNLLIKIL